MTNIENLDWAAVRDNLHRRGYAQLDRVMDEMECDELIAQYDNPAHYRKTIVMERYRFGLGEYKYFTYPLPQIIQRLREIIYPKLAPIANQWMQVLKKDQPYPAHFAEFQEICKTENQTKPTVLILKYGRGGHNTLHQDLYGDVFFPIQMVLFLSEPEQDYTGGEFVMTEQVPRAQSKAIVLKPRKGDALLFTTNFRPVKGSKGYYRVNMKHGVSEVHEGERYTLGIIFHDALS
ncbi:2OG-Fe(II) oxygenase [Dyadobacter sp. CY261]|uniref:2OG-Fe(II) oxygenase n=1 Tax=Dyadobacter sp. CY261 TaxID=2907203 RepID=UPI001F20AACC|nr:2OG-Fe(II) oxygenase [Dyadobacter sp. CY261]MCF0069918.1 2OG-Fe(II) oxygenase [Dyadobacter sp. CY261]